MNELSLTFNIDKWNDLPRDESVPFEWWLGEGEKRLQLASAINPAVKEQPAGGVPLFFAHVVRGHAGGALCQYFGHFTTRSFRTLKEIQDFKGKLRQAKIELVFDHFDERLAAAINKA